MLYFEKNLARIPSRIYEPMYKHAENALISYQYPCSIAIHISGILDIPESLFLFINWIVL